MFDFVYSARQKIAKAIKPLDAGEKGGTRVHKLARFALKCTVAEFYYVGTHIKKNGSIVKGVKEYYKETFLEDAPGVADLYAAGKSEGKREGYALASATLGEEIRDLGRQLVALKKQGRKLSEKQRREYGKVIDLYDKELVRLQGIVNKTASENEYLKQILEEREILRGEDEIVPLS